VNARKSLLLVLAAAILACGCTQASSRTDVASSAAGIQPALIGTTIPNVCVQTPDGKFHNLRAYLAQKPTVLVIYRGNWCVYCQKQLADLKRIQPDLMTLGYQIVAVSPDSPQELQKSIAGRNLDYVLLSDTHMDAAKTLGLAFYVDPETRREMERFGVSAVNLSAQPQWMLPVPAVFIVNTSGGVRWEYVNPDYRERVPTDVLLSAARSLAEK